MPTVRHITILFFLLLASTVTTYHATICQAMHEFLQALYRPGGVRKDRRLNGRGMAMAHLLRTGHGDTQMKDATRLTRSQFELLLQWCVAPWPQFN